jgi:photosystem II stability/assembly factor-like uncharacterized protein
MMHSQGNKSHKDAWKVAVSGTSKTLNSITFGANKFVTVGRNSVILTSSDGTTWTPVHLEDTSCFFSLNSVTYQANTFVAVGSIGDSAGLILTSPDGVTWTNTFSGAEQLNAVTYGAGKFLAIGENGTTLTSADGTTWTWTKASLGTDIVGG